MSFKWNDRIGLVRGQYDINDTAQAKTAVFADKKSVGQSEFYNASVAGYRTVLKFDVHSLEYEGEELVEFPLDSGKLYKVIRTYEHGEYTELTLAEKAGVM